MSVPTAPDSEKFILSLCFQHPEQILPRAQGDGLTRDHFLVPAHAFLWDYFVESRRKEHPIDLVLTTQDLRTRGDLGIYWEGPQGLAEIFSFACTKAQYPNHLTKVIQAHARRLAIQSAQDLVRIGEDVTSEPDELEKTARRTLESLSQALASSSRVWSAKEGCEAFTGFLESLMASGGKPGLPCGIPDIDGLNGGPRRGELWTISAPTSMGKTVLLLQMAGGMARNGYKPLIFSLELTVDEVIARILAGVFGADYGTCTGSNCTRDGLQTVLEATRKLTACDLYIKDDPEMTSSRVQAEVERMADREGIDVVIVDYLQLLDGERARNERADEEISRNVKMLKQTAKKLDLVVLTASQVNDDGKLFGSRAIGFHSDVVLQIGEAGIQVIKNRNGQRGQILPLTLNGPAQCFDPMNPFEADSHTSR